MKISGFTMVRNADKYYFPVKESILSILPVVDEFIVALGDCDEDDHTREQIDSIQSGKIKIFDRKWDKHEFAAGAIYANETNFALSKCSGDWCFYLQADEVVHEKDLDKIVHSCQTRLHDPQVDGLLFKYHHFFGDYEHYLPFHGWYKNEIRVVRNHANIFSYRDAQSFRKNNNRKLNVVETDAHIYHYGWVRPPELMQTKKDVMDAMYRGEDQKGTGGAELDYGALGKIPVFRGSHPRVMTDFISKIGWKDKLNYSRKANPARPLFKHEKFRYLLLTLLENALNGGRSFGGYTNWNKIRTTDK